MCVSWSTGRCWKANVGEAVGEGGVLEMIVTGISQSSISLNPGNLTLTRMRYYIIVNNEPAQGSKRVHVPRLS